MDFKSEANHVQLSRDSLSEDGMMRNIKTNCGLNEPLFWVDEHPAARPSVSNSAAIRVVVACSLVSAVEKPERVAVFIMQHCYNN